MFFDVRTGRCLLVAQVVLLLPALTASAQRTKGETNIEVKAADYALIVADTIAAGTHRWSLTNTGNARHEMIIARLAPNADAAAVVDSLHARGLRAFFPGNPAVAVASSALLAAPNSKADAELITRDRPGDRLIVFCQLRDGDGKPKHDELGMFKVIHVR
jgi:hypothetical protein